MRPSPRILLAIAALVLAGPLPAQRPATDHGTITIVLGREPTLPVPILSYASQDLDVAALLFLPLARIGRALETTREDRFEPGLAKSWTRRDSVTLAFDLDPRAKWHDGKPVTAHDVVWTLEQARDSAIAPVTALLLRRITGVTAEGDRRVVFRFSHAYAEQMYDAVFHAPPLPAHLLAEVPFAEIPGSPYARAPIGNGPYRWGRVETGRQVELVADPSFFLGEPKLTRVIFLLVRNAEAQINMVLDGTADAFEGFLIARDIRPVINRPELTIRTFPSLSVGYLLFNHAAPGDGARPHPILGDPNVRRAIAHAINRPRLLRAVFGPYASRAEGPFGRASWVRRIAPEGPDFDAGKARRLLAESGWRDSDGDGVLDKAGRPLRLSLNYPGTSIPRVALAEPIQGMLRQVGIQLDLVRLDGPVWAQRRGQGQFDIDFSQASLDPTPSGLVQSWSCAGIGGTNVGRICSAAFDDALHRAIEAAGDATEPWRAAIRTLQDQTPAVFLFSPADVVVLHRRYRQVSFRPEARWADLWRWSVDSARRLPRDEPPKP